MLLIRPETASFTRTIIDLAWGPALACTIVSVTCLRSQQDFSGGISTEENRVAVIFFREKKQAFLLKFLFSTMLVLNTYSLFYAMNLRCTLFGAQMSESNALVATGLFLVRMS